MLSFFGVSQRLSFSMQSKCPDRENQWFQPFFGSELLQPKGRSLTKSARQCKQRFQNPGHRLPLKLSRPTKWRSRTSQRFQRSLFRDSVLTPTKTLSKLPKSKMSASIRTFQQRHLRARSEDQRKDHGLTRSSLFRFTHQLRQSAQDFDWRFLPCILTTHNLLVKNECKITSSQIYHSQEKLLEVRQV